MSPVKGKAGLTATMWVLLVVLGLLVIVGVVLWMLAKGAPNYGPSRTELQELTLYTSLSPRRTVPVA